MKRAVTLGLLMVVGALSLALHAAQQPAGTQPMVVEVEKLKDNLFVLRGNGGGGNTAVFVQANGVTVVDTKNPGWGQPILDKIRELTPKPVTRIVNCDPVPRPLWLLCFVPVSASRPSPRHPPPASSRRRRSHP